jgi:hypothetical protein
VLLICLQEGSVFRVFEPNLGNSNQHPQDRWFRVSREFFLPYEAYDVAFHRDCFVALSSHGFDLVNYADFETVTIPQCTDPSLEKLARQLDACRPLGMFRVAMDEFFLCYNSPSRPASFACCSIPAD